MRISQFRGALPAASLPDGRGERKPAQSDRRVPSKWTQRAPPTTGKARVDVSFVMVKTVFRAFKMNRKHCREVNY